MKLSLSFALLLTALLVDAASFKVKKVKRSHLTTRQNSNGQVSVPNPANAVNLTSVHDLIYLADIQIAETNYTVQLDTGSSDLWVKPDTTPVPGVKYTDQTVNLTYAIGYAAGQISYAPVEFLGLPVAQQAFLNVTSAVNAALRYSDGVVGLGFTGRSVIDAAINKTNEDIGRSLLYNLFQVHPDEPNFIAFALHRATDSNDDDEGTFSIGEYDPAYASISGNNRIPTWPIHNPVRWNVLLDAVIVHGETIVPEARLEDSPTNKAIVLLDSGASHTYCPPDIATAIYGNISGAYYDTNLEYWRVPCNAEVDMALQIGGQVFPLHPLDVTPEAALDATVCIGSFIPSPPAAEYDWLIGDNFLRNVYTVYDFGDFDATGKMGDPYVKLLALVTDPDEASAEFAKARNTTARTNITYVGLDGAQIDPVFTISKDISDSLELIGKLIPAMLGIVALNAIVVIVCCIVWLMGFLKKRRNRRQGQIREVRGRTTPMPLTPRNSYIPGTPPPMPHVYEPVSMALTEDTFVPPSPAFRFENGKLNPGDRPKSVA